MRKSLFLGLATVAAFVGCNKTVTSTTTVYTVDCSGTAKSYATDVAPLIQTYCATNSNCHAAGSTEGPGALTTYTQVYNDRNSIRSEIYSGGMPEGTTLTAAQKNAIICWIDNGASNN